MLSKYDQVIDTCSLAFLQLSVGAGRSIHQESIPESNQENDRLHSYSILLVMCTSELKFIK